MWAESLNVGKSLSLTGHSHDNAFGISLPVWSMPLSIAIADNAFAIGQ